MRTIEDVDLDPTLPVETIRSTVRDHPVRTAVLFGSRASDRHHPGSDVDVAVELERLRPGDPGYNDAFFGLSADLSDALGTDDVDLVDLHACSPSFARSIFDRGVLLSGDPERVAQLREELTGGTTDDRSPRERLDEAVAELDELLG